MKITSKERARLRAMANDMQPVFQIGKGGLTPVITDELDSVLEARELIKISVLETCAQDARELCETLSERLRAGAVYRTQIRNLQAVKGGKTYRT